MGISGNVEILNRRLPRNFKDVVEYVFRTIRVGLFGGMYEPSYNKFSSLANKEILVKTPHPTTSGQFGDVPRHRNAGPTRERLDVESPSGRV